MKEINIHEIEGFQIGNATDIENATGCTVIIAPNGATAGVDVRGGGPATRETDLLNPKNMVQKIHSVTLSGGSAFGLEASCGVMQYLSEKGIGFDMKDIVVPICCQASLFDLAVGNPKAFPDKAMGYEAAKNSEINHIECGNFGAGTGASVGKLLGTACSMKTGLGVYALQSGSVQVGAIVAVNACGDVFFPNSNEPIATILKDGNHMFTEDVMLQLAEQMESQCCQNTTIACIITNANLDKAQMNKVASIAHNAYARTIRPVHTSNDGDTIFTMSTNKVAANQDVVGVLAVKALEQAIVNAAIHSDSAYGLTAYKDLKNKSISQ